MLTNSHRDEICDLDVYILHHSSGGFETAYSILTNVAASANVQIPS